MEILKSMFNKITFFKKLIKHVWFFFLGKVDDRWNGNFELCQVNTPKNLILTSGFFSKRNNTQRFHNLRGISSLLKYNSSIIAGSIIGGNLDISDDSIDSLGMKSCEKRRRENDEAEEVPKSKKEALGPEAPYSRIRAQVDEEKYVNSFIRKHLKLKNDSASFQKN